MDGAARMLNKDQRGREMGINYRTPAALALMN
jgi:hypothetical protein